MPAGVYVRKSLRERFCERVSPEALTGCHLWTAGVDRKGYGKFWFDGATRVATHAAWMLAYGHRPDGFILHTCDTPSCVNPDHLFIGTAADNIADKVARMLKSGEMNAHVINRKEFLDSLADQIVTAAGVGHCAGMDVPGAVEVVDHSNWSKFVDGEPVFDNNGKITKGPDYFKPDLEGFY